MFGGGGGAAGMPQRQPGESVVDYVARLAALLHHG